MILGPSIGDLCEPLTGRRVTGQSIPERCEQRVLHYRSLGLAAGDRVLLHHGNSLEFFVDLLALWRLGACAVPIDPRLTSFELETLARAAAPRAAIWSGEPEAGQAASLAALGTLILESPEGDVPSASSHGRTAGGLTLDADALVLFTSGTTGNPKGVVHTHRSLRARWTSLRAHVGLRGLERTLCLLPTHFGHGLICNALYPWLSGRDLYVLPPFRPDLVLQLGGLLDEHRITFMSSVPALWRLALKTAPPPRRRSLERVFCGSAPLSAAMWRDMREWTGAPEVSNAYGITEVGSWLAGATSPPLEPQDGLVGEPWGGVVTVLRSLDARHGRPELVPCAPGEVGYVWVSTPALMRGYLDRDDLTRDVVSDGWFATGDVGVIDDRGRLSLRGREREEINKGGIKVYPGDIDAVLEQLDEVVDVCAFAYADALAGEEVGVAVVLRTTDDDTVRRLHSWARGRLAAYQLPRRWWSLDEIPRSGRGKVNRAVVAARCASLAPLDPQRGPRQVRS